jgi:hypothetical protein
MSSATARPSLSSAISNSVEKLTSSTSKLLSRVSSLFQQEKDKDVLDLAEPPQYLLDHFNADRKKAAKAQQKILNWRLDNDIDDRLKYKPRNYDTVAEYLHSNAIGRGKNGKDIVLVESYSPYNLKRFKELGIEPKDFQDFVIIWQEYVHKILNKDPNMEEENGIYTVLDASSLDVKGLLNPKISKYNDICLHTLDNYYVTRSKKIFVVNHPRIFNMFWPAVKAAMPANLRGKVVLVRNKEEIEEYIDLEILSKRLGGTSENEAGENEMFLEFQRYINALPSEEEYLQILEK